MGGVKCADGPLRSSDVKAACKWPLVASACEYPLSQPGFWSQFPRLLHPSCHPHDGKVGFTLVGRKSLLG